MRRSRSVYTWAWHVFCWFRSNENPNARTECNWISEHGVNCSDVVKERPGSDKTCLDLSRLNEGHCCVIGLREECRRYRSSTNRNPSVFYFLATTRRVACMYGVYRSLLAIAFLRWRKLPVLRKLTSLELVLKITRLQKLSPLVMTPFWAWIGIFNVIRRGRLSQHLLSSCYFKFYEVLWYWQWRIEADL